MEWNHKIVNMMSSRDNILNYCIFSVSAAILGLTSFCFGAAFFSFVLELV